MWEHGRVVQDAATGETAGSRETGWETGWEPAGVTNTGVPGCAPGE